MNVAELDAAAFKPLWLILFIRQNDSYPKMISAFYVNVNKC